MKQYDFIYDKIIRDQIIRREERPRPHAPLPEPRPIEEEEGEKKNSNRGVIIVQL
jgi:hypothetical protein